MQKRRLYVLYGCVACVAVLSACSGNKELPSGKRVAVLEDVRTIEKSADAKAQKISVPTPVTNSEWLQNDMSASHLLPNLKTGQNFAKQWTAGFGKGSSKRDILLARPLAKNGVVYTLDADGVLSALQLKDGEKIWSLELEANNKRVSATALKGSGIAIQGDRIYVTTGFGVVAAVDLKKQTKVWESNLQAPIRIAPVVANGKLFVQSIDNKFFALDAADGHILWQHDIALESTTLVGGAQAAYEKKSDIVVTGFSNGELQSFNATLGLPLWSDILVSNRLAYSSTFLHTLKAAPIIENGVVYALGNADVLVAVNLISGERIWEQPLGGTQTPLLIADTIYMISDEKQLVALNKKDGEVIWTTTVESDKDTHIYAPLMLNGRLIVTVSDGHVYSYDPHDGSLKNTVDLDEDLNSAPLVVDEYILFTTKNAKLLAFK